MNVATTLDKDRTASARTVELLTLSRFLARQQERRDGTLTAAQEEELRSDEELVERVVRVCPVDEARRRSSREALRDLEELFVFLRTTTRRPLVRTTARRRHGRTRVSGPHARRRARSTPARGPDDADGGEHDGDLAGTGLAR